MSDSTECSGPTRSPAVLLTLACLVSMAGPAFAQSLSAQDAAPTSDGPTISTSIPAATAWLVGHDMQRAATTSRTSASAGQTTQPASPPPVVDDRDRPVSRFVVDARGGLAAFGPSAALAASRDLPTEQLPQRGYALDVGAHFYPLRLGIITFGVGGSYMTARATWTPNLEKTPDASQVVMRFSAISPQLSLNFGRRMGWSYLSGGMFTSTLSLDRVTEIRQPSPALKTINYGGGARWFSKKRVAFSFDVRFFAVNPAPATFTYRGNPRRTFKLLMAGVSFR